MGLSLAQFIEMLGITAVKHTHTKGNKIQLCSTVKIPTKNIIKWTYES